MFGRRFDLFRAFGIPIRVDVSWFMVAVLISWSMASMYSTWLPGLTAGSYWAMGIAWALGLFASIVLHELGHALTARRFGVGMDGITLFIFGGVAEMRSEPPSAKAEFWVAVAGPAVSVVLAVVFWVSAVTLGGLEIGERGGSYLLSSDGPVWATATLAVIWFLAIMNGMLVVFNMIPAFPLDGGRVLRSVIWGVKGDLKRATEITSNIGSAFGLFLIVIGVLRFINGDMFGGIWSGMIGWFLRQAASGSYQHLLLRRALEGETVSRFMQRDVVTVEPGLNVKEFVENVVYRFHYKMYPVVEDGRLVGCVTTRRIKVLDRGAWETMPLREVMEPCDESNSIGPDADAMTALARMNRGKVSRLMVTSEGRLMGIVSLKDLLGFMAMRVELGEE